MVLRLVIKYESNFLERGLVRNSEASSIRWHNTSLIASETFFVFNIESRTTLTLHLRSIMMIEMQLQLALGLNRRVVNVR